jgi:hypothetical protein
MFVVLLVFEATASWLCVLKMTQNVFCHKDISLAKLDLFSIEEVRREVRLHPASLEKK